MGMLERVFKKLDEVRVEVRTMGVIETVKTELDRAKKKAMEIKDKVLAKAKELRGKAKAKVEEKKQEITRKSSTKLKGGM